MIPERWQADNVQRLEFTAFIQLVVQGDSAFHHAVCGGRKTPQFSAAASISGITAIKVEGLNNRVAGLVKKAFGCRGREQFWASVLIHPGGLHVSPADEKPKETS